MIKFAVTLTKGDNRKILEGMPGVGRKTANVVLSNLFNVPCIAVDTHVERVSKRLGLAKDSDDVKTIEKKLQKKKQIYLNSLQKFLMVH